MCTLLAGCGSDDPTQGHTSPVRVGILSGADIFDSAIDAFKAQMTLYGYIEGDNITYDFRAASGDMIQMEAICDQFVDDDVDLIFTTTNNAALAARGATVGTDIPVVFTFVIAPVETGVVDDRTQPGGNITGVMNPLDIFIGKRLEFLLQLAPAATRLWVPYNPQYPTVTSVLAELRHVAPTVGVTLVETEVMTEAEVIAALARVDDAATLDFDAIIIFPDLTVQLPASWAAILAFAQTHHLPILANTPAQVEQGALFSYLSDNEATGRQAARLVDQILDGANPGDLPVEAAEQFLTVNVRTATALGLTVPESVLVASSTIIR